MTKKITLNKILYRHFILQETTPYGDNKQNPCWQVQAETLDEARSIVKKHEKYPLTDHRPEFKLTFVGCIYKDHQTKPHRTPDLWTDEAWHNFVASMMSDQ